MHFCQLLVAYLVFITGSMSAAIAGDQARAGHSRLL
jgi:hypothetical protein